MTNETWRNNLNLGDAVAIEVGYVLARTADAHRATPREDAVLVF